MRQARNALAWGLTVVLAMAAMVSAPEIARAELQRVEAVGIYGIRDSMRKRVIARDEAVAKARWEGVSRVALELIGESAPSDVDYADESRPTIEQRGEPITPPIDSHRRPRDATIQDGSNGPSDDQLAALKSALGRDVLPYMRSYRILDDRGEVPVLFREAPDVSVEYVVVVEVIVDVDRVTRALETAGLIDRMSQEEMGEAVTIELIGLKRFEALELVLGALENEFGARRIRTVEFSRGRQVLLVEGPFGPDSLSRKMARFESPRLVLEPIGVDSVRRRIRLLGRWFPDSEKSRDTPAAKTGSKGLPRS